MDTRWLVDTVSCNLITSSAGIRSHGSGNHSSVVVLEKKVGVTRLSGPAERASSYQRGLKPAGWAAGHK